jgi:hypothetical protein
VKGYVGYNLIPLNISRGSVCFSVFNISANNFGSQRYQVIGDVLRLSISSCVYLRLSPRDTGAVRTNLMNAKYPPIR